MKVRLVKERFLAAIAAVLFLILIVVIRHLSAAPNDTPLAKQGVLQLPNGVLQHQKIIRLDGEWIFYPHQLLTPDEIYRMKPENSYMQVPGNWSTGTLHNGKKMDGHGEGTYRLFIRNAPADMALAINKQYIRFADAMFVDGKLLGQSGVPGSSKGGYTPRNVPYTVYFEPRGTEIEIVLQVANFDSQEGGIFNSIELGPSKQLERRKNLQMVLELTITLLLLTFSFLFLYVYGFIQRNRIVLLHSLFFLCFAAAVITNGERLLLDLLPMLPFEIAFKIKYLSVYLMPVLVMQIVNQIAAGRFVAKLLQASSAAVGLYGLFILAAPFRMYTLVQDPMYLLNMCFYFAIIVYLLAMYWRKRYGSISRDQFQLLILSVGMVLLISILSIASSSNLVSQTVVNEITLLEMVLFAFFLIYQYGRSYEAMQQLTKKLQQADQMKDDFLLLTSHELNTPLHGMIHLSQSVLASPLRKQNESDARKKLEMIRNIAYRMSNTVNDLIDTSRFKDGRLNVAVQTVDLVTSLSVVTEVFGFLSLSKGVVLSHQIDLESRYVRADERRLLQVLYNIMYFNMGMPDLKEIHISCQREGDRVVISILCKQEQVSRAIKDTGHTPVMHDDEDLQSRLDFSRKLIQQMDGQLIVLQAIPLIRVSLPIVDREDAAASIVADDDANPSVEAMVAATAQADSNASAATIVLATANLVDLEHLYSLLSMEGFRIVVTTSDAAAYEALSTSEVPDLLIVDAHLPSGNGYSLCKRLRQEYSQVELPVLFIHARSTPADIEACIAAGGNDFINRPLDAGEILVRVHTLLGVKRLVKESAANEMAFLRSQIKPHFLYNALGTIMSLCYTDGAKAGELLGVFSRYLRILFHFDNTEELIPLSKEMELISAYLDIEKERFGSRLSVQMDVDPSLHSCRMMPLLIEPLVENAIRHGVSKKVSGGTVKLSIRKHNDKVQVIVEDDGVGMTSQQISRLFERPSNEQGIGLFNISRRLKHLNGRAPVVVSEHGIGTKVMIEFPLQS
ncbi:histidine kinase [Paenibacillus baekrokdamisoli]|uniref:histidine kinase n=2 Tax=Paenibacillus baekrokdamisoli TaxID=1712516 RepID=A0A3G9JHJ8_9BACL|nr:signal transduction histidine kinase/CheY-like chemotaxis protein [Paenibacillus baekrokdamisoli]BBH22514.1 histidine kinase [Paenibacillus baekrokdamisoli]